MTKKKDEEKPDDAEAIEEEITEKEEDAEELEEKIEAAEESGESGEEIEALRAELEQANNEIAELRKDLRIALREKKEGNDGSNSHGNSDGGSSEDDPNAERRDGGDSGEGNGDPDSSDELGPNDQPLEEDSSDTRDTMPPEATGRWYRARGKK